MPTETIMLLPPSHHRLYNTAIQCVKIHAFRIFYFKRAFGTSLGFQTTTEFLNNYELYI